MGRSIWWAALLGAVLVGHAGASAQVGEAAPLKLHMRSLDLSEFGPGRTGFLDITIERWSTDEERDRLRTAVAAKGPDGLLQVLQALRPRAGYIRSPGSIGWTLRFAHAYAAPDGGRRIVVAAERPLGRGERLNPRPITRYLFTLAEIRLDRDGRGEGTLVPAARVWWNQEQDVPEVAEYATLPVRLTSVTAQTRR
jgi:hypothetical protein